jgi:hypothetical protein
MVSITTLRIFFLLPMALAGCIPTSPQNHTPTPTEFIHVHSYFSAYAFLDANDNGQFDSADTPLKDATFIVALQGGTEFGEQTDDAGYAFITIPASVEYPVTARIEAPKDSTFKAIEPSTMILSGATAETIQFLFSSK